MTLVDSNVWITAWRGIDNSITNRLAQLIEGQEVFINHLIRTELLQGAGDKKHQRHLQSLLEPIPIAPFPENLWDESPKLFLESKQKGITITTIDCLIATHALLNQATLWSLDKIFSKIPHLKLMKLMS